MGSSSSKTPSKQEEILSKVTRSKGREACYAARDEYFECKADHGTTYLETCKEIHQRFVDTCPASWIAHFEESNALKQDRFVRK